MSIKKMVLADVTVSVITQRIRDIASSKHDPISKTCWNYVGMYLRKHEDTVGTILMYTCPGPGPHTVSHAMLVDKGGKSLCDSLSGERSHNDATYQRKGFDEAYVLLAKVPWPM